MIESKQPDNYHFHGAPEYTIDTHLRIIEEKPYNSIKSESSKPPSADIFQTI